MSEGDAITPLMAAPRDASWYASPNTRTPKQMHVVVAVEGTDSMIPACHGGRTLSSAMPLDETMAMPASEVPEGARCKRPGCKVRWPR